MSTQPALSQEEVYKKYGDKVLAYIKFRVSSPEDAEDLQANVFYKVFKQWEKYESEKASISTWIYTIARNEVIDYYRTKHTTEEVPEDIQDASETEEEILQNETLEELADALNLLDQKEKELIVLHYYNNETLRSISKMMNLTYDQTKNIHYKALKRMRNLLGPDF